MYNEVPKKAWMLPAKATLWTGIWCVVSVPVCAWPDSRPCWSTELCMEALLSSAVGDGLQEGTVAMEGFCVINIYFSPLWDVGKGSELSQLICFRGVLERDCQLEASWCCKSFMQFHRRGFLYPWGLQVLCRHSKLFCAWALFPAHFLAESRFSKGCSNVWEVDLALCLCLWSGWWSGSLWPLLYVLLPLMPDLVVCLLLPSVTESFPWVAQFSISLMQNRMCYSGMK